jgi:CheY-like chemotaxis protein
VGRLRQVVTNLVGNAIKFTDAGEVLLDIRLQSLCARDAELHLVVRDTGIGIPLDRRERIFEAFEQVDTSTTRRFGGTGLGLAISTRLVELMGGRIWVESEVGTGSTFHFTVRLDVADQDGSPDPTRALHALHGLSVLIVDDNNTNLRILQETLSTWGMHAEVASSAADALDRLRHANASGRQFQLLLTDANMPRRDGFWLIQQIRQRPDWNDMPILLLTSGDRSGDYDRCQELNVQRYLTKPVKPSELLDAIGAAFDLTPLVRHSAQTLTDEAGHLRNLRILLAEDSLPNQKLARGLLRKLDHEVVVAGDGVAALDNWKSRPFDVILMDVQMPHMDGLEATRLIRKREEASGQHVPIIAMTAHAMRGDEQRCLDAGMDAYVAKPIRPEDLYRAIDAACRGRFANPAAHAAGESEQVAPSAIDWQAALDVVQNDEELLAEVVDAVLEEVPRLVGELAAAMDAHDLRAIQRLAHTIKGNMRTFCMQSGEVLAGELERQAREGRLQNERGRYEQLKRHADAFLTALRNSPYAGHSRPSE